MALAFPGYVSDVSTGLLDPDWGNAIRDRAIQVFDTSTNRDAALTSPQTGQVGVLTTLGTAGLYVRAGATVGWRPPWNLPWGSVVTPVVTTGLNQGVTSTTPVDLTGITVTFTAVANRLYRVSFGGLICVQSSAGGTTKGWLTDGSNALLSNFLEVVLTNTGAGSRANGVTTHVLSGLSAGSVTVKARAQTSAGTATFSGDSGSAVTLVVEDIGPNGAPS